MEKLMAFLKMNSNAFYPMLVTVLSLAANIIFSSLNGVNVCQDRKLLTRLHYKIKSVFFILTLYSVNLEIYFLDVLRHF